MSYKLFNLQLHKVTTQSNNDFCCLKIELFYEFLKKCTVDKGRPLYNVFSSKVYIELTCQQIVKHYFQCTVLLYTVTLKTLKTNFIRGHQCHQRSFLSRPRLNRTTRLKCRSYTEARMSVINRTFIFQCMKNTVSYEK